MKFKIKRYPSIVKRNKFLLLPRQFGRYKYWLCWVVVECYYKNSFQGYESFGEIIKIGKK